MDRGGGPYAERRATDGYVGIYYWNDGRPELMLYKRIAGNWAALGESYISGPLAAGTRLKVMAVGSTILFLENDTLRVWSLTAVSPAVSLAS